MAKKYTEEELLSLKRLTGSIKYGKELIKKYPEKFDWWQLIVKGIDEDLLDYVPDEYWKYVPINLKLSEETIIKYSDKLNWNDVSLYQTFSLDFIDKYGDKLNWYAFSHNKNITEEIIEKYSDDIYFDVLFESVKVSEKIIEKYAVSDDWKHISYNQVLSESFIEKHKDDVIWYDISRWQKLSKEFIEKNIRYIDLDALQCNNVIDKEIIDELLFKYNKLLKPCNRKYKINDLNNKILQDNADWDSISKMDDLSESFIKTYSDKLNWNIIISKYKEKNNIDKIIKLIKNK